ncbi:hypothetical protein Hanom_Chr03g00246391 [Helianthus anomalus]
MLLSCCYFFHHRPSFLHLFSFSSPLRSLPDPLLLDSLLCYSLLPLLNQQLLYPYSQSPRLELSSFLSSTSIGSLSGSSSPFSSSPSPSFFSFTSFSISSTASFFSLTSSAALSVETVPFSTVSATSAVVPSSPITVHFISNNKVKAYYKSALMQDLSISSNFKVLLILIIFSFL